MIAVFDIGQSKTSAGIFSEAGTLVYSMNLPGRDLLVSRKNEIVSFLSKEKINHIIMGIAGLSRLNEMWKTDFISIAESVSIPSEKISFYSDAALLGFQIPKGSLGLSIGTGSVIIKKETDGNVSLYGGWGFLFGDELSGTWWYRETVRQALRELESNKEKLEVVEWLCKKHGIIPERTLLIKSVYSNERNIQAQIGSESVSVFQNSEWMKKSMKMGLDSFFENIPADFNLVCLQGGLLLTSDWLQSEIIKIVKMMNPNASIEPVHSLLPGGFQCWKSL